MKRTRRWSCLAVPVVLLALTAFLTQTPARAQSAYNFRDLGTLGGSYSVAYSVNNLGQVVGRSTKAGHQSQDARAFYWSAATGMIDIGTLGGTYSYAWSINNHGDVVGTSPDATGNLRAFLWNKTTRTLTDLNTLLSPSDAANWVLFGAMQINDNRVVVGTGTVLSGGTASSHAYLFDLSTVTLLDLGTLPGQTSSNATALNQQPLPWVVGSSGSTAFLYAGTPPPTVLAPLKSASAVDNAGDCAGTYQPAGANAHPGYVSASTGFIDLGTFGGLTGAVRGINNASPALMVGSADVNQKNTNMPRAFRCWVGSSFKQDLNSLTVNLGKWYLISAQAVSDTGYIAGKMDKVGYETGNTHAFLLSPQ